MVTVTLALSDRAFPIYHFGGVFRKLLLNLGPLESKLISKNVSFCQCSLFVHHKDPIGVQFYRREGNVEFAVEAMRLYYRLLDQFGGVWMTDVEMPIVLEN